MTQRIRITTPSKKHRQMGAGVQQAAGGRNPGCMPFLGVVWLCFFRKHAFLWQGSLPYDFGLQFPASTACRFPCSSGHSRVCGD